VPGQRQIWVLQNGQPVQMAVKTGITDGRNTEVSGEGLAEGMEVIIDQKNAGAGR
jgi:HlyD family secretion protein